MTEDERIEPVEVHELLFKEACNLARILRSDGYKSKSLEILTLKYPNFVQNLLRDYDRLKKIEKTANTFTDNMVEFQNDPVYCGESFEALCDALSQQGGTGA